MSQLYADTLVTLTFSKLGGPHLLSAWIQLAALAAELPGRDWTAVCIGRSSDQGLARRRFGCLDDPVAVLRDLVAIYDAGRSQPIPLPVKTSYAWAAARFDNANTQGRRRPQSPEHAARRRWTFDRDDPAVERIWGKEPDLSVLLGPPRPDEEAYGETTGLGAYAARLWLPLLQAERSDT